MWNIWVFRGKSGPVTPEAKQVEEPAPCDRAPADSRPGPRDCDIAGRVWDSIVYHGPGGPVFRDV